MALEILVVLVPVDLGQRGGRESPNQTCCAWVVVPLNHKGETTVEIKN